MFQRVMWIRKYEKRRKRERLIVKGGAENWWEIAYFVYSHSNSVLWSENVHDYGVICCGILFVKGVEDLPCVMLVVVHVWCEPGATNFPLDITQKLMPNKGKGIQKIRFKSLWRKIKDKINKRKVE